jgi:hypothetical protein|tara:strand:- start:589 stop:711 length:123 start_codon:yes stop_codon:yes gene_type:complete
MVEMAQTTLVVVEEELVVTQEQSVELVVQVDLELLYFVIK